MGPVRSARLTDIYLGQEWEFVLAYAGAGRTTSRLWETACSPCSRPPSWASAWMARRTHGTGAPGAHNLFVKVSDAREARAPGAGERRGGGDPALPLHEGPLEVGPCGR